MIHQESAEYAPWVKLLFLIPAAIFIGAIISAFFSEYIGALFLVGEGVFFVLVFYFIFPRRFEIYESKLRIVLGSPFTIDIPFSTIKEVRHASGVQAYFYTGIRFATSSRYVIEIMRNKGFNYVISPQNGDLFLAQLEQAVNRKAY